MMNKMTKLTARKERNQTILMMFWKALFHYWRHAIVTLKTRVITLQIWIVQWSRGVEMPNCPNLKSMTRWRQSGSFSVIDSANLTWSTFAYRPRRVMYQAFLPSPQVTHKTLIFICWIKLRNNLIITKICLKLFSRKQQHFRDSFSLGNLPSSLGKLPLHSRGLFDPPPYGCCKNTWPTTMFKGKNKNKSPASCPIFMMPHSFKDLKNTWPSPWFFRPL